MAGKRSITGHAWRVGAAVTALLLVAAACGDDDDSTSSATTTAATTATTAAAGATTAASATTAAAAGASTTAGGGSATTAASGAASGSGAGAISPTQGVTDTAIKVGGVTAINAQGFTYVDQCNGAQVLFNKVNATGGINGRKIDYVGCRDDGATTDKDTAETRRLIEQDKVFAIVPASIVFTGSDVAAKAGIPYFGWGISPYFCNNNQGFGFNGCTGPTTDQWVSTSSANLIKTIAPNAKKIGTIHHDIPPGRVNGAAIDKGLKAAGYDVVYDDGSVPLTGVADWTPYVQKIVAANPDVFFSELSYTVPLAAALKAAGYKGIIMDAVSYNPKLLQDAASAQALEGMYMTTNQAPYESANAGIKQMVADVQQYGNKDQALTSELAQGYYAAAMFVDIATKAGKDLTYESFYKVANGGTYCFDGGGALGKACFPKAHTDSVPCNGLVTVTDKKFISKLDITCAQPGPGSSGSTPGA